MYSEAWTRFQQTSKLESFATISNGSNHCCRALHLRYLWGSWNTLGIDQRISEIILMFSCEWPQQNSIKSHFLFHFQKQSSGGALQKSYSERLCYIPATLLRKNSSIVVFLWILQNFSEQFFEPSWRSSKSYRNQLIDLQNKSTDWFLYDETFVMEELMNTCERWMLLVFPM